MGGDWCMWWGAAVAMVLLWAMCYLALRRLDGTALYAGIGRNMDCHCPPHRYSQAYLPAALCPNSPTKNTFLQELNAVLQQDRYFCSEELTRDAVCRRMHTNRTTFSKKLQEATDMTFSEYLREMRLQEAARLLRETDMPIDQIAFEVEMRSVSGFHRNFLLSYGMTPKQYREN